MRMVYVVGGVLAVAIIMHGGYRASAQQTEVLASDAAFIREAATGGLAEVELGRLATERATKDPVRRFGLRMVMDHSRANNELSVLAQQKGIAFPTEPDVGHRSVRDRLSNVRGVEFDHAYMSEMVKDHTKTVADFERQAQTGQDPALKAWAAHTLPVLREHLRLAQELHGQVARDVAGAAPAAAVPTAAVGEPLWCAGAYQPGRGTNFAGCVR